MVKSGMASAGDLTRGLPPLSIGNALAISAWNRSAPEFRPAEILLNLHRDHVDDLELMLERIDIIRHERRSARQ